jgi:hypothetical protein
MKILKIFFVISLIVLSHKLSHAGTYPSTLWSSERIPDNLIGVRVGQIMGDVAPEIVALARQRLFVFQYNGGTLTKRVDFGANTREDWVKLVLFDINSDGLNEVIVSGFRFDRVQSIVGRIEGDQFVKIQEVPYFLQKIQWQGQDLLVAQKSLGGDDFSGHLIKMAFNGKKLIKKGIIKLPSGVSVDSMSLFSVTGMHIEDDENLIFLSPTGKFVHYRKEGKKFNRKWASGVSYGGAVTYLNRKVKDALNQVTSSRFLVPPSFRNNSDVPVLRPYVNASRYPECKKLKKKERANTPCVSEAGPVVTMDEEGNALEVKPKVIINNYPNTKSIYVMKNEGYLKNVIGAVPSIKASQMVRLSYTGYGFQEDWNSPRLDGAISDFTLVDWDGDGREEILASFLLRDRGYVDTLKKQDSLLIVIKP